MTASIWSLGLVRLKREVLSLAALPIALAALGVASTLLYDNGKFLHRFSQGISAYIATFIAQFALYLGACYAVLRSPRSRLLTVTLIAFTVMWFFATLFRATLITQPPYLSSDVHRYIWDGRVQASGINPYRYVPSAPELAHLRDQGIYPGINRKDYALTIYPPVAQGIFLASYLISPSSITTFKVVMSLFDGIAVLAIMLALSKLENDPLRVIIFAWHPLVIWEGSHSGHIESAAMAFLALAVLAWAYKKQATSGVALALATLIKFYPLLLLPLFLLSKPGRASYGEQHDLRNSFVRAGPEKDSGECRATRSSLFAALASGFSARTLLGFVLTVALAYLPYLSVGTGVIGYLPGYFKEEGFVSGGTRYFLLALARKLVPVPTEAYYLVAGLSVVGLVGWWMLRARNGIDLPSRAVELIGFFLIVSTPRYGWYIAWLIPFLCFAPGIGWLYLTGASIFLYLLWLTTAYPSIPLWLGAAMYVPTLALVYWERVSRSGSRQSLRPHGNDAAILSSPDAPNENQTFIRR